MTKIYRYILILILLFIISPVKNQRVYADEREDNLKLSGELIWNLRVATEHFKLSRINKVMDRLKIRPGMTILDIGTGTGQYAYRFAEKLKGTGKVFATDVDINCINYVTEEAHKRGLTNLYPVLVKREGIDEFYSKHKYDLIFLSHVYFYFVDPVNYFKKMRDFLAEDGRLVIIGYKSFRFGFSLDDFTDFEGLIKEFSLEPADSPFYKGLRESTWELIKQKSEGEPNELLKNAIVDDFNSILLNPHFCSNFLKDGLIFKKEVSFSPEEREYANWLVHYLKLRKERFFDKAQKDLKGKYILTEMLNKLLIIQRFRQYLYKGGIAPYLSSGGDENMQPERFLIVKRQFEKAGYKLENEYDFIPYMFILVLTANKYAEGE